MTEQIASRQEYVSCQPILEALDLLYYEPVEGRGRIKRGATNRDRGGSLDRFIAFLRQIDSTYDLYGMSGQGILDILPPEFDAWKGE